MNPLTDQVTELIVRAREVINDPDVVTTLDQAAHRLHQPLRVAIAGKIKAGKSTLLNAIVGERLAPTDAGECTKIVTWYADGTTYRVNLHLNEGPSRQVPFRRDDGALEIDLGGIGASSVDHIEIEWPSKALQTLTLIDTPGIDSINTHISERTTDFLTPEDGPSDADAVLYLMRHLHETDIRFLEAFHDQVASHPNTINSIGVLSRADEIGVGRLDAMTSARHIAARYRTDPRVRKLCQTVIPVAGLVAETASTLRQDEFSALSRLAALPRTQLDDLMLSVDRFTADSTDIDVTPRERTDLLARFGLFGIRLSCALIRQQAATTSSELASLLLQRSGLAELVSTLTTQFAARGDILRARSALLSIEQVLTTHRSPATEVLDAAFERIMAGVHEFAEIELLNAIRAGSVLLNDADRMRAERLLGGEGGFLHERLSLDASSEHADLTQHVITEHGYWQAMAENPLSSQAVSQAARTLVRSCEGMLAALAAAR